MRGILFHDYFNKEITSSVFDIKKYNLNLQIYNKPFMCNSGVEYSINDKIVILDSDRILPDNYFYNNAVTLSENDFVKGTFYEEVYLLKNGVKRPVTRNYWLRYYGDNYGNVKVVDQSLLVDIPNGAVLDI